jgi:hypothetical protein
VKGPCSASTAPTGWTIATEVLTPSCTFRGQHRTKLAIGAISASPTMDRCASTEPDGRRGALGWQGVVIDLRDATRRRADGAVRRGPARGRAAVAVVAGVEVELFEAAPGDAYLGALNGYSQSFSSRFQSVIA